MTRLTLMHDTANITCRIGSETTLLKRWMEIKGPEITLERLPIALDNINRALDELKGILDTWYTEDKAKEAGINIK